MKRSILYCMTTLLASCAYTPIELPDVNLSQAACPDVTPALTNAARCPTVPMPLPIPSNVYIEIREGKAVRVDPGGEQLLRQYAAIRKALDSHNTVTGRMYRLPRSDPSVQPITVDRSD
jgi:hypothetical protein